MDELSERHDSSNSGAIDSTTSDARDLVSKSLQVKDLVTKR